MTSEWGFKQEKVYSKTAVEKEVMQVLVKKYNLISEFNNSKFSL